jgi:AAA ATPase domain/Helicase HerA, central domain
MQGTGIDNGELTTWLTRTAQTIDRSLRDQARIGAVAELSAGLAIPAPLSVLAQVALLDDCLRVATLALDAGGEPGADELERVSPLIHLAASKYFTILPNYESFGDGAATAREVERFLETYRADIGPFGHSAAPSWRGVALVQRVDQATHNASPRRDHEHMLARIMDVVFDGRATAAEAEARRQLRLQFEPALGAGMDPRAMAFCREDGPEVFASVAHGSQVHVRDPFDVESIHADARDVFHRQVERAIAPARSGQGHGRTMLVLGESGSGKTHLLRALRHQLCSQRRGYAGYLQMSTEVGDYARYVLRNFIDSMERPYDAPTLGESSLLYLSNGLAEGYVEHDAADLEALRTGELEGETLHDVVGRMVDRILRTAGLESLEPDLLHALLLLQRRDAAIQRRVIQFLRCESLTGHEQRLLGGLVPRLQPEDPMRTLKQLGAIAFELQMACMVFLVDQVEDTLPEAGNISRLQQAFDVLRGIADAIPSSVVVISCLTDVYDEVKKRLTRSLLDRLEHEPPPTRLTHQRNADEIEDMLVRRLDHLYTAFDVAWREDDPLYPFTPAQLAALSNFRTRDVLAAMYRFHQECIAAGEIRDASALGATVAEPAPPPPPASPGESAEPSIAELAKLDQLWNDAKVAGGIDLDDSEAGLLALVAGALLDAAGELGVELTMEQRQRSEIPQLVVEAIGLPRRLIEVCNRAPQGGRLAGQLEALTLQAGAERLVAVALRRGDFEFTRGSLINRRIGELRAADGLPVVLEDVELRAIIAARKLAQAGVPNFAAWRRARRPLCELAMVRQILDLDSPRTPTVSGWKRPGKYPRGTTVTGIAAEAFARTPAPMKAPAQGAMAATGSPPPRASTSSSAGAGASVEPPPLPPPPRASTPVALRPPARPATHGSGPTTSATAAEAGQPAIRLGTAVTLRAEPMSLPLSAVRTHLAFLGSAGSGKTPAALTVIERLLEQGISALLIDRKGELARYASEAWWAAEDLGPDSDRRRALRSRIELALYTPGNALGRPLHLPLVPPMIDATSADRDQLATFAAAGLAAVMGYGRGSASGHKQSVLMRAIQLCGLDQGEITLEMLYDCVAGRDPELLSSVGGLQRYFSPLAEDLQSLLIQRGPLLGGTGEPLDLQKLLPLPEAGRPRLTVISTTALGDGPMQQFWVARLLTALDRLAVKRPRQDLAGAIFLDEVERYLPSGGQPPAKEPMFSLLRRARTRGLGVLLASQNPADLDYRARENVATWLVGKVNQERAPERMRGLLAEYPQVGARLATQPAGHFFVLGGQGGSAGKNAHEIKIDRAMMEPSPMSESEIAALARETAARR